MGALEAFQLAFTLPHLPDTFGRELTSHPLSQLVALMIKTFPPQGESAEWHWLSLLTLPVLPKPDIPGATEQILQPRPDLLETVLSILGEWFPYLTRKEIMALINLPKAAEFHPKNLLYGGGNKPINRVRKIYLRS